MSNKRPLHLTSPEYTDKNKCKKLLPNRNMAEQNNSSQDVFSWGKLCSLLDDKLKDVTRKADLVDLKADIDELKKENLQLKSDVKKLTTRLELIDRRSRSSNVVVSGLKSEKINAVKVEFSKLCAEVLNVNINIMSARMISLGKACFTLESSMQVLNVTSAKNKLKGKTIFIQKDYTEGEQNVRYNLRQLSKGISKSKQTVKVRLGEFCIFINNIKYTWSMGKIMANTSADAVFLNNLLTECNYPADVCINEGRQNTVANLENNTSQ